MESISAERKQQLEMLEKCGLVASIIDMLQDRPGVLSKNDREFCQRADSEMGQIRDYIAGIKLGTPTGSNVEGSPAIPELITVKDWDLLTKCITSAAKRGVDLSDLNNLQIKFRKLDASVKQFSGNPAAKSEVKEEPLLVVRNPGLSGHREAAVLASDPKSEPTFYPKEGARNWKAIELAVASKCAGEERGRLLSFLHDAASCMDRAIKLAAPTSPVKLLLVLQDVTGNVVGPVASVVAATAQVEVLVVDHRSASKEKVFVDKCESVVASQEFTEVCHDEIAKVSDYSRLLLKFLDS